MSATDQGNSPQGFSTEILPTDCQSVHLSWWANCIKLCHPHAQLYDMTYSTAAMIPTNYEFTQALPGKYKQIDPLHLKCNSSTH